MSDSETRCVVVMLIGGVARGDLASFVSHAYSFTLPPCGGREPRGISCFQLGGLLAIWYEVKGAGGGAQESCAFFFVFLIKAPYSKKSRGAVVRVQWF